MVNSFYPAAQRVAKNPIVRWIGGVLLAGLMAALTTGVWPFFKGWVATRADTESVEKIDVRVAKIENARSVDFERLDSANSDDTGALTEGEQLQWALIRIKRLQLRVVSETRRNVGLEAMLRMPNPRSEQAQRMAATVRATFDDLVFKGDDPETAARKAMEFVYGTPRR